MPTVLKQLTIKTIGCEPRAAAKQNRQFFLCRIFGEANHSRTKEGKNGDPYSLLIGAFRAECPLPPAPPQAELPGMPDTPPPATSKAFDSDTLLLPGGLEGQIEKLLKSSGGKPVQFGYDVFSIPAPANVSGFTYHAVEVITPVTSDHLTAIANTVAKVPLPSNNPAPAPAPEPPLFSSAPSELPPQEPPIAVVDNGKLLVGKPAAATPAPRKQAPKKR
jgi:hypothetical protein